MALQALDDPSLFAQLETKRAEHHKGVFLDATWNPELACDLSLIGREIKRRGLSHTDEYVQAVF